MVDVLIIVVSVVCLVALSRLTVDRSLRLGDHLNITGTFVGLTVLSIGTSLPELASGVAGSLRILRDPSQLETISGLVVGGNIGSDIFQQNIALPVVALVGGVLVARRDQLAELGGLVAASIVVLMVGAGGLISRPEGLGLVALYLVYLWQLSARHIGGTNTTHRGLPPGAGRRIAVSLGVGFFLLTIVATVLLDRAERLVDRTGLSASFLGLATLGVAAALPELTTALAAVRRNERGAAAGILIGSNVTNPLLALGLGAAISTYSVPAVVLTYDLPVKIATAGLLTFFLHRSRLARGPAIVLMVLYLLYLLGRVALAPTDVV